ncbi:MAG: hypothetical protein IPJ82_00190 [Lewinellaceae bacterium]|nr:hypothetical protein [Lewinellaceae bacterium]
MRSPVFKRFMLKVLVAETFPSSMIPMAAQQSSDLVNWLEAGFIEKEQRGRHIIYRVIDREALWEVFYQKFPGEADDDGSAVDNVRAFADSKARARTTQGVCFLRGWQSVLLNGCTVDLSETTQQFGLFAAVLSDLKADRICLVENLDGFLQAEKVVGTDWLLLHTYGRVGKGGSKIGCREMPVFLTTIFVGLEEFLRVREALSRCSIFYARTLRGPWVKICQTPQKPGR